MPSFSEQSFGARLSKAQALLNALQNFQNYNPPNPKFTPAAFADLLLDINQANNAETEAEVSYIEAVQNRQNAFWKHSDSVIKLLAPIRAAVEAQYSRKSPEYERIRDNIMNVRSHRSLKKNSSAAELISHNKKQVSEDQINIKTVSHSQLSYGSLERNFSDLVISLSSLPAYNPSNPKLQLPNLQTFVDTLQTLQNHVIEKLNDLQNRRKTRLDLYHDLQGRISLIKAYIRAEYGLSSNEYKAVKAIKV